MIVLDGTGFPLEASKTYLLANSVSRIGGFTLLNSSIKNVGRGTSRNPERDLGPLVTIFDSLLPSGLYTV